MLGGMATTTTHPGAPTATRTRRAPVQLVRMSAGVRVEGAVADRRWLLDRLDQARTAVATDGHDVHRIVRDPEVVGHRLGSARRLAEAPWLTLGEAAELRVTLAALHALLPLLDGDRRAADLDALRLVTIIDHCDAVLS